MSKIFIECNHCGVPLYEYEYNDPAEQLDEEKLIPIPPQTKGEPGTAYTCHNCKQWHDFSRVKVAE